MPASTMTLTGTSVSASIKTSAQNEQGDEIKSANITISEGITITFPNGFADGQADHVVSRYYEINATTDEILDLSTVAAGWDNAFGDDVIFHSIKAMLITNVSVNDDTEMRIGNAAGTQWFTWCDSNTSFVRVYRGGVFLLSFPGYAGQDGYAVAAGPMLLLIRNAGGANGRVKVTFLGQTGT